ncbi:MAG: hypothetical protein IPH55_06615 [Betaproteobacteria bacterium]|nr:hypothetical protein [Betaproteobacteria bacterium]
MIAAASDGIVIEMADFHRLLLAIKQRGLIADCVSFASGNNLDKMFIQLKPKDFPRRIAVLRDSLEDWRHR